MHFGVESEERRVAKVEAVSEPKQAAAVSSSWHMSPAELVWPFLLQRESVLDNSKVAGYKALLYS